MAASPPPPARSAAPAGVDARWTSTDPSRRSRGAGCTSRRVSITVDARRAARRGGGGERARGQRTGARSTSASFPTSTPARCSSKLRAHLAARGFPDVRVELRTSIPPARCDLHTPLARRRAPGGRASSSTAREPICHAIVPGSGPLHLIAGDLGIPTVMPPGTIRPDSGMHGPDENALIDHYLDEVAFTVRLLELLREGGSIGTAGAAGRTRPQGPTSIEEQTDE